ncbi:Efflux pump roqT [Ceratocystis fimbriata CBS 114723]|uniref:Efflux pump roqT n=1 Tax=Ceratocystis fimbriata CBS 114723 TaxID=1035309 RepID=A0A2C5WWV9_9PEZI|nr:Efflux pump roqT [Ceratocystis fimbriata CBS 114723]
MIHKPRPFAPRGSPAMSRASQNAPSTLPSSQFYPHAPAAKSAHSTIYINRTSTQTRPSPIYAPRTRRGSGLRYDYSEKALSFDLSQSSISLAMGSDNDADGDLDKDEDVQRLVGEDESNMKYPSSAGRMVILLSLCLSVFLMALDNSIIATAIPKITDEFASLNDVGWYGTSYLLATASLQLLFGKFYTFFCIKTVYISAIVVFEIGSLICAAAPTSLVLIIGRTIAGAGGAGIFSGALVILAYTVPIEKRPMYAGYVGSVWGISSLAGPLLGGLFADTLTWRWCFWINIPIGAVSLTLLTLCLKIPKRAANRPSLMSIISQLDLPGNALFIPSVVCLLLALEQAGTKLPWNSPRIIGLLATSGTLFILFIILQFYLKDKATIPFRVMKKRTVWSAAIFTFHLGAAYVVSVYYLPIWFQAVKGASALQSGLMNLPLLLIVVVFSVIIGMAVTATGMFAPFMILSSVFMAAGYSLFELLDINSSPALWVGVQLIAGTGVGCGLQLPVMAAQSVLDMADVATGTAIMVFLQTLGGSVFVAVAQSVFAQALTKKLEQAVPGVDAEMILKVGATAVKDLGTEGDVRLITVAYSEALREVFLVCAVTAGVSTIGSLAAEWRSIKKNNQK